MKKTVAILAAIFFFLIPASLSSGQEGPPQDFLTGTDFSFRSLGTSPDGKNAGDVLTLGSLEQLGLSDLTVRESLANNNLSPNEVPLSEYKLATEQDVKSLIKSVEGLSAYALDDVPPIAKIYDQNFAQRTIYIESEDRDFTVTTVGDALYIFELFGFSDQLASIDLSGFNIDSIPKLADTKSSRFENFKNAVLNQIPGLASYGLSSLLGLDYFVKIDIPFGMSKPDYEEHDIKNSASGTRKNLSTPCPADNDCAHAEVWRPSGGQRKLNWFSGDSQDWLPGGWGAGLAICNEEPTGRFPFGDLPIKMVMTTIDETKGEVEFALYYAQEIFSPFGKIGETAHCFGPFPMPSPFSPVKENGWTLFGFDDPADLPFDFPVGELLRGSGGNPGGGEGGSPNPTQEEILENAVDCEAGASSSYINPTSGRVSSGFGWRWGRKHNGIDIANAQGTPVYASNCGVVDFVDYQGGYGNVLTIQHTNANTLYAHLQFAPLVKEGESVKKGQLIGYMGTTGRSTGPHLHFEYHLGRFGNPIDPDRVITF